MTLDAESSRDPQTYCQRVFALGKFGPDYRDRASGVEYL